MILDREPENEKTGQDRIVRLHTGHRGGGDPVFDLFHSGLSAG